MDTSGEFTAVLIDHFGQIEHVDNLNLELLIKTVERISVKKNGEIIVTFINKATVESEENNNGTSTEPMHFQKPGILSGFLHRLSAISEYLKIVLFRCCKNIYYVVK